MAARVSAQARASTSFWRVERSAVRRVSETELFGGFGGGFEGAEVGDERPASWMRISSAVSSGLEANSTRSRWGCRRRWRASFSFEQRAAGGGDGGVGVVAARSARSMPAKTAWRL
jgi:hypothetical protein